MRALRTPAVLLILLISGFLLFVNQTASMLPERLATHFGAGGQPNGWMSRSGYTTFISLFGVALPLFVIVICFLCRFLPAWTVNIPNREYWLSPERHSQTYAVSAGTQHLVGVSGSCTDSWNALFDDRSQPQHSSSPARRSHDNALGHFPGVSGHLGYRSRAPLPASSLTARRQGSGNGHAPGTDRHTNDRAPVLAS